MSRKLVELLYKEKLLTQSQYQDAEAIFKGNGDAIRQFIEKKVLSEQKLLLFLNQKFSLQSINLAKFEVKPEVVATISADLARKAQAIPIQMSRGILVVAVPDPTQIAFLDDIRFATKMNVEAVLTTFTAFDAAFLKYYSGTQNLGRALEQFKKDAQGPKGGKEELQVQQIEQFQVHDVNSAGGDDAPVISVVNSVLTEAIRRGASDIHVEPYGSVSMEPSLTSHTFRWK